MTARTLALALLAPLAACSAPADTPPASGDTDPPEASGDVAREAGLSDAQGAALRTLGAPVLLPRMGPEWTVEIAESDTEYGASYEIRWRRGDGACVVLFGASDGLGGPDYPPVSTTVRLAGLPGAPEARLYKAPDDPATPSAQNWGPGTVVSDYVEAGEMWVWLTSNDEARCRPLALEEAAPLFASLRPLPQDGQEVSAFGTFEDADDVLVDFLTDFPTAAAPAADVQTFLGGWEASEILVEDLGTTASGATVLASLLGYADDSVEGERLMFTFVPASGGGWELQTVGRQVRCWAGRGHTTWSPEPCL